MRKPLTEKIIEKVHNWQSRRLDKVYPILWLDAVHYKIREEGQVLSKAVYTVLALDMEGKKKEFIKDLKRVYQAVSSDIAETELYALEDRWGKKYPLVIKSWQNNCERLSQYFKYPAEIRRLVYTTNPVEAVQMNSKHFLNAFYNS